jgi:hypothetical protein
MKLNYQPNLLPLILITIGSTLLAVPGAFGSMFLFMFAAEGVKSANPASLLIPLPAVIGFGLLFGYYWTLVKKRHIGWFWMVSLIFNGLISKLCLLGVAYALYESGFKSPGESLFALFPLWTLFVAFASGYYFKHRDGATSKIRLP